MTRRTPTEPTQAFRHEGAAVLGVVEELAVEAPLNVELDGEVVATTLRTPGADPALALGLLFAEGAFVHMDDVVEVRTESREVDLVAVRTSGGVGRGRPRRLGLLTSACGACGRLGLDELLASVRPVRPGRSLRADAVVEALEAMRAAQPFFERTGGTHAAAAFDESGQKLASAEDVGRHNAVDKVVGALLVAGTLPRAHLLVVSGRASFEIVHKAAAADFAALVSVSAPSSLAVAVANGAGMVLVGFAREAGANVYAGRERFVAER